MLSLVILRFLDDFMGFFVVGCLPPWSKCVLDAFSIQPPFPAAVLFLGSKQSRPSIGGAFLCQAFRVKYTPQV